MRVIKQDDGTLRHSEYGLFGFPSKNKTVKSLKELESDYGCCVRVTDENNKTLYYEWVGQPLALWSIETATEHRLKEGDTFTVGTYTIKIIKFYTFHMLVENITWKS